MSRRLIVTVLFAFLFSFVFVQANRYDYLFQLEFIKSERPFSAGEISEMEDRQAENFSILKEESVSLTRDNKEFSKTACFTNENFANLMRLNIIEGRFLSSEDYEQEKNICVLEKETAAQWFEGGAAAGEEIKIEGETFTIVGVTEGIKYWPEGKQAALYIPFSTAGRYFEAAEADYILTEKTSASALNIGREETEVSRLNFLRFLFAGN